MNTFLKTGMAILCIAILSACEPSAQPVAVSTEPPVVEPGPTVADAVQFVDEAEQRLGQLEQNSERMQWVLQNFITEDTEILAAKAGEEFTAAQVELAARAAEFVGIVDLDYDTRRKLDFLAQWHCHASSPGRCQNR